MKHLFYEFIKKWNSEHEDFTISTSDIPEIGRPTAIYLRYDASEYVEFLLGIRVYDTLKSVVELKSQGTLYLTTDEELFQRGIINIAVASSNAIYSERTIMGVIQWVVMEFFPQI